MDVASSRHLGAPVMPTRVLRLRHGREMVVRPLRNGDVETVMTVFDRLGERSRRLRFNGPKPSLAPAELVTNDPTLPAMFIVPETVPA